jgi:hypothetical protein
MLSCPYGMYVFPVFYCLQKYIFPSWTWFLCQILNNIKVASSGLDNHVMPKTEWVVENVVVETCPSSFTKKKNIFVLPSYCGCCCCYYPPSPLRLLPLLCGLTIRGLGKRKKNGFFQWRPSWKAWAGGRGSSTPPRLFSWTSNLPLQFPVGRQRCRSSTFVALPLFKKIYLKILHHFLLALVCYVCLCFGKPTRHHLLLLRNLILYCVLCAF